MQSPVIQQLLLMMENPWVVMTLALVCIMLRVIWMLFRRRRPLPMRTAPPPKPRDLAFDLLTAGFVLPPLAILIWLPVPGTQRIIVAVMLYLALYALGKVAWAPVRRRRPLPASPGGPVQFRQKDYGIEIIDTLIIALVLVFGIVRPFLLQTFFIPSGSMIPTLEINDKLIANKFVLRFRAPEHGEIIVFQPPVEAVIGGAPQPYLALRVYLEQAENPLSLSADEVHAITVSLVAQSLAYSELHMQGAVGTNGAVSTGRYRTAFEYGMRAAVAQVPRMYADWLARNGQAAHADTPELRAAFLLDQLPQLPTQYDAYIKRVVGVPGDVITIVPDEGIYVNGAPLDESYLASARMREEAAFPSSPSSPGAMQRLDMYLASSDGATDQTAAWGEFGNDFLMWVREWYQYHKLYEALIAPHIEAGAFVVPDDAVFVMGDNRSSGGSFDSRYWGVVPLKNIKARAVSTFWPLERLTLL